nr:MAG TPA: hypothetical protein [Caudoviricetes sp.]
MFRVKQFETKGHSSKNNARWAMLSVRWAMLNKT